MPMMTRGRPRLRALVLAAAIAAAGCAQPYSGARTLAAVGAGLLIGGSLVWIAGERGSHRGLVNPGFGTALAGAGVIAGAAGWMATTVSCRVDPDCPYGEECREVPAPPGGIPYRQCRRR
jgi:hypothetical protein